MAIHDRYTEEEVEYIKKYYPTASWDKMLADLNRDKDSITTKAYRLGVKREDRKFINYTDEEDKLIAELYANTDYGSLNSRINALIAEKMPNRTLLSIKDRANRLGCYIRNPWTEEGHSR